MNAPAIIIADSYLNANYFSCHFQVRVDDPELPGLPPAHGVALHCHPPLPPPTEVLGPHPLGPHAGAGATGQQAPGGGQGQRRRGQQE
jgi:hypothetical protein